MYDEGEEGEVRVSMVTYSPVIGKDMVLRIQIPDWIETPEEQIAYEWGFAKGAQMGSDRMKLRAMERGLREGTAPNHAD